MDSAAVIAELLELLRVATHSLTLQVCLRRRGAANDLDLLSRPPKAARLNDGISIALPDASVSQTLINKLVR
ncbi:hypothetical protein RND71_020381 [Anisodus tanguticus]|uniref:Uncharacterized protein n=1 Tax=Anisodus tanguticus TaxID=243964 RepID=A0AAE1S219_9SOLA|nr:hypothetical protein RND71_020381 [Anisodus tanguticus]